MPIPNAILRLRPYKIRYQRDAVAIQFGLARTDVEEYQPTRPRHSRVRVWSVGGGYAVAVKVSENVPEAIWREFEPWKEIGTLGGWTTWASGV